MVLAAAIPAVAQHAPHDDGREVLPNFDRRSFAASPVATASSGAVTVAGASLAATTSAAAPVATAAARAQAVATLTWAVPGARVERNAFTGAASFVGSNRGFLTGPIAVSAAAAAATATSPAPATTTGAPVDAQATVRAFVDRHADVFGHRSNVLTGARIRREYVTRHNGLRTVIWEQRLDDIPIFEAVFQAHVTARGEIVNLASGFLADPEAAAQRPAAARTTLAATPPISAAAAITIAAQGLGENLNAAGVTAVDTPQGNDRRQRFAAAPLTDSAAHLVWLPLDGATLRLCWEVICTSRARGEMFRVLVDAETGETLVRQGLTEYISNASYRVFTSDSPTPFSPGHATPSTVQPPTVARSLVTLSALSVTASPNGWINDGVMETRGNNVEAHTDTNADNVADLPRPQATGANRVFDPPLDLTQAPSTYKDAAVVNLFYWCNWMHDQLYELGFDEAAGNFQIDNFGRGGVGGDPLQADAQDGSGTNNANFSSPSDGTSPRMQMFLWTGPTPDRDGDFDVEVVLHEYAHGLSNRLVGGGVGISALASRGLGEGWGDFYGIALLAEPGDDLNGNWARGGYARYGAGGGTFFQNYYFGGRRYPYSTNLSKNPLTFKDIDPTQASPHTGIPVSPIVGSQADEVHNSGEVWCVTLWEARTNLINKHGFAIGHRLILQLVTDGMKLSPANPNFLQARDAILQADLVANGGANRNELWAAFAKRGMGFNAIAPVSTTTVGLVENFDLPDDLGITPIPPVEVVGQVGGPFNPSSASFVLTNTGAAPLSWTATENAAWLTLSSAGGTLAVGATTTVIALIDAAANSLLDGVYVAPIVFTNTTNGAVQSRAVRLEVQPVQVPLFTENFESGALDPSRWTVSGTGTFRTQITTANGPHGGVRHLTMDSTADNSSARNEATLTLNLAGEQGVRLVFWAKSFGDEAHGPLANLFISGADFDGVAISADGINWYEVQPVRSTGTPPLTATWSRFTVDLDPLLAARGLAFNSAFKIRFNQFDNFRIPTDGIAFDDIQVVRIVGASPPVISAQPQNRTADAGTAVTFSVTATAVPAPTYQWKFNGLAIAGATGSSLTVNHAQLVHVGTYAVTLTNGFGSITSASATLSGTAAAPTLTQQPVNTLVTAGQDAVLTVGAAGAAPLLYQWRRNGFAIAGATGASYTLASASRSDADYYDVLVGSGLSLTVSQTIRLSVAPTNYATLVAPDPVWDLRPERAFSSGSASAVASLADGRCYLGGSFVSVNGTRRTSLLRTLADGTLDTAFAPPEIDGTVRALAVQSDGRLIVGGDFVRVNGAVRNRLIRLNPDGSLDPTFGTSAGTNNQVRVLAVQADGRILVGGDFSSVNGISRSFLARLNADGAVDASFLTLGFDNIINALAVRSDGKVLVGGFFTTGHQDINGVFTARTRLAQLHVDGTLDTAFNPNINSAVNAIALQADGKIVAGGTFTVVNGTTVGNIARLNADGTLDPAFATASGTGFNSTVNALAVQGDGKILAGGSFFSYSGATTNYFARLNANGTRDTGLLTLGFDSTVNALAVQATGKIVASGFFFNYRNASNVFTPRLGFARLNADGTLDPGINFTLRSRGEINTTLALPGGKLLVTGYFTAMRGATVPTAVARINADGTVDPTFNPGGGGANSTVYAAARQADGKILIGGFLSGYNGTTRNSIARLNADGTLDPAYNGGGSGGVPVYTIVPLPGGRAFVGGSFTSFHGVARNRVAVLDAAGALDASFDPGSGANALIYTAVAQPDGKIVIGGEFTTYRGVSVGRLARLNPDGTLDATFNPGGIGATNGTVSSVALQPNGQMVVGGFFGSYNGTARSGLARLNADGTLDPGFATPSLFSVYGLLVQEDGKVVVRGAFSSVGGAVGTAYLGRLNADGSRDASFAGAGFATVLSLPTVFAMRDNGQLAFGSSDISGFAATQASSLPAIATPPQDRFGILGGTTTFSVTPEPNVLPLSFQWFHNGTPLAGAIGPSLVLTNLLPASAGSYTVVIRNELGSATSAPVTLTLAPTLVAQFASRSVGLGGATTFAVVASSGAPLTYQWFKDGLSLAGATTASFALSAVTTADAGSYRVVISDASGSTPSLPGVLTVLPNPLSYGSRQFVDFLGLAAFFAIEGSQPKRLLLRAVGPTLAALGTAGMLADPKLEVVDANGVIITANDDWGSVTAVDLSFVFSQVGAIPLIAGGKDSAVYATFSPGSYAVRVRGASGGEGLVLLELFDADTNPLSRLAYVGLHGRTDATNGAMTGGLSITNSANKRMLLRAIGPSQRSILAHPNPQIQVLDLASVVAQNDDWGGGPDLVSAAAQAGAFALPLSSTDAAVLVNTRIGTGAYTVQAPPAEGSGDVLLEFYDLPPSGSSQLAPLVIGPRIGQNHLVAPDFSLALHAVAIGSGPLSYSWRRSGITVPGATTSTLSIAAAQPGDAGVYVARVTGPFGTAVSAPASISVGDTAAHTALGGGYQPGATLTIMNTLSYAGGADEVGWKTTLPPGWTYVSSGPTAGEVKPDEGATGTLQWSWSTALGLGPLTFNYTVRAPGVVSGPQLFAAEGMVRRNAIIVRPPAQPDPVTINEAVNHSADTDQDFQLSLFELTRVIELYNTRNGTVRTGAYRVDATNPEDGFGADSPRAAGATVVLTRYHSADTRGATTGSPRDGALDLFELTRVIELYNTRAGTVRTGRYHVQQNTEDGFAAGP